MVDARTIRSKIQVVVNRKIRDRLEEVTPKKTGQLARSWFVAFTDADSFDVSVINPSGNIIKWLDEGTGIYGPKKQVIRPKVAEALHWIDDAGNHIFAKWVRGIEPREFVKKVVNDEVFNEVSNEITSWLRDTIIQELKFKYGGR